MTGKREKKGQEMEREDGVTLMREFRVSQWVES